MATAAATTTTTRRERPVREAIGEMGRALGTTTRTVRRVATIIDVKLQEEELEARIDLAHYKAEVAKEVGASYDVKAEITKLLNQTI